MPLYAVRMPSWDYSFAFRIDRPVGPHVEPGSYWTMNMDPHPGKVRRPSHLVFHASQNLTRLISAFGAARVSEMMTLYEVQGKPHIDPETYLKLALENSFQRVQAVSITSCPLCNSTKAGRIGSYIYYSHFVTLKQCGQCGLGYADTRLCDQIVTSHFETAYKNEEYFSMRSKTYEDVLAIIRNLSSGNRLLDVGCAKGHFLQMAGLAGFDGVGCDISRVAVSHCKEVGLTVHQSEVWKINYPDASFDIITCLDTLYYSRNLKDDIAKCICLLRNDEILCFRIPHRNLNWFRRLATVVTLARMRRHYNNLMFFNPEHSYVFEISVLAEYFRKRGLQCVAVEAAVEGRFYKTGGILERMLQICVRLNRTLRLPLGSVTVVFKKS